MQAVRLTEHFERCPKSTRPCARWLAAMLVAAVPLTEAGCRFHFRGFKNPVPRYVSTCRELTQQGQSAMDRGDYAEAGELFRRAISNCDQDVEARRQYAQALWHQQKYHEAIEQLDAAIALTPDDASLHLQAAQMSFAAEHFNRASNEVRETLELDPQLAAAWRLRGQIVLKLGRPEQAIADYHRALRLAPGDPETLLLLAELHYQQKQPRRALATLQRLGDAYPPGNEPQRLHHLTGVAYLSVGQYHQAVESLSLALDRGPDSAEICFQLGEAYLLAGRFQQAQAAAQRALRSEPNHQASLKLLKQIQVARQNQHTLTR